MYQTIILHQSQLIKTYLSWLLHFKRYKSFYEDLILNSINEEYGITQTGRQRHFFVNHKMVGEIPAWKVASIDHEGNANISYKNGNLYSVRINRENEKEKVEKGDYLSFQRKKSETNWEYITKNKKSLNCKSIGSVNPVWESRKGGIMRGLSFDYNTKFPAPPGPHMYFPTNDGKKIVDIDDNQLPKYFDENFEGIITNGNELNEVAKRLVDRTDEEFYWSHMKINEEREIRSYIGDTVYETLVYSTITEKKKLRRFLEIVGMLKPINLGKYTNFALPKTIIVELYILTKCIGELILERLNGEYVCFTGGGFNCWMNFIEENINQLIEVGLIDKQGKIQPQRLVGGIKMHTPKLQACTIVASNNKDFESLWNLFRKSNPSFFVLKNSRIETSFGNIIPIYQYIQQTWGITRMLSTSNIKYSEKYGTGDISKDWELIYKRLDKHLIPCEKLMNGV